MVVEPEADVGRAAADVEADRAALRRAVVLVLDRPLVREELPGRLPLALHARLGDVDAVALGQDGRRRVLVEGAVGVFPLAGVDGELAVGEGLGVGESEVEGLDALLRGLEEDEEEHALEEVRRHTVRLVPLEVVADAAGPPRGVGEVDEVVEQEAAITGLGREEVEERRGGEGLFPAGTKNVWS